MMKSKWKGMELFKSGDDFEKVFQHMCYNEIRLAPEEHPIFIMEKLFTPRNSREKMTSLIFDTFDAPGLVFLPQELGILIASGNTAGLIVNVGYTQTTIVPIWKMNILRDVAVVLPLGGNDVIEGLLNFTRKLSPDLKSSIAEDMMIEIAYCAEDYNKEMSAENKPVSYELPDGQVVSVKEERFMCSEILFSPELFGLEGPGIIKGIEQVLGKLQVSNAACYHDVIKNPIIISGGPAQLAGFAKRVKKDIGSVDVKVAEEPQSHSWVGGAVFAGMFHEHQFLEDMITTKQEYDEFGPRIVHSKCL